MLKLIVLKEITESLLNRRFLVIAGFSVLLLVISGGVNYEYYQTRKAAFDNQYNAFESERAESQLRAYRPPALLSVMARGTEPYMPLFFDLGKNDNTLGRIDAGNIEAEDFRLLAALGSLDFLFLIQVVFSLLAILLSFDMVAGEKERGTLKAVLSNSVPRDKVILGKALGGFSVLLLVFILGTLLFYALLSVMDGRFLGGDTFARVGAVMGVSAIYIASFFMLGLMVSSMCHSGRTAIVSLLVVWVTLQLVIPKLAETTATVGRPVRSEEAVRTERSAIIDEIDERKMVEGGELYMDIFNSDQLSSSRVQEETADGQRFRDEYLRLTEQLAQEKATRLREIDEAFERERRHQRRLSYALSLLSPSAAYGFLVSDIAGTGDIAYERFQDEASDYYAQLRSGPLDALTTAAVRVRVGGSSFWMNTGDEVDWENIPGFESTNPGLSTAIQKNAWAMVSMLMYLLIPFLIAYVSFIRYDAR